MIFFSGAVFFFTYAVILDWCFAPSLLFTSRSRAKIWVRSEFVPVFHCSKLVKFRTLDSERSSPYYLSSTSTVWNVFHTSDLLRVFLSQNYSITFWLNQRFNGTLRTFGRLPANSFFLWLWKIYNRFQNKPPTWNVTNGVLRFNVCGDYHGTCRFRVVWV